MGGRNDSTAAGEQGTARQGAPDRQPLSQDRDGQGSPADARARDQRPSQAQRWGKSGDAAVHHPGLRLPDQLQRPVSGEEPSIRRRQVRRLSGGGENQSGCWTPFPSSGGGASEGVSQRPGSSWRVRPQSLSRLKRVERATPSSLATRSRLLR